MLWIQLSLFNDSDQKTDAFTHKFDWIKIFSKVDVDKWTKNRSATKVHCFFFGTNLSYLDVQFHLIANRISSTWLGGILFFIVLKKIIHSSIHSFSSAYPGVACRAAASLAKPRLPSHWRTPRHLRTSRVTQSLQCVPGLPLTEGSKGQTDVWATSTGFS